MSLRPSWRHEGAADLAPFLGADGNILQIGFRRRQASSRGRGERVRCVDAAGSRIDEARQGVGVGRLELRDLPPFEHARWQLMALGGEVLEHARRRRPGAGRGLLAAGQAHLAEQNIAELLRRAGIDRRADNSVDLGLEFGHALSELARHTRQDVAVDRDPAALHTRQNIDERALEPLIHRRHLLGDEARLQNAHETQGDVGLLRSVFAPLFDRRTREFQGFCGPSPRLR